MITIEQLRFINEEVILTKPTEKKQTTEKVNDVFSNSSLPQDKTDYILMKVFRVGEKQTEVKVGDKVLVSEQFLGQGEIKIRGQVAFEDYKKLINANPIFAIVND